MPKTSKIKQLWTLFITFFKIGLFTFGGGYAMIPLIQDQVVNKHKWLRAQEMNDMILIAESTPGPIAINSSTYVGYRVGGFLGAFFATLGVVLPSFCIILIISYFFRDLLSFPLIAAAFKGIKIAVAILILDAAWRIGKAIKFDVYSIIMLIVIFILQIVFSILNIRISSIYFIIMGMLLGLVLYGLVPYLKGRKK
ncbi:MAG: chromate transporter [Bacilli bacterium]|jgi:chromate transporter|nr:chromate transporter [Bacilli bacterium]